MSEEKQFIVKLNLDELYVLKEWLYYTQEEYEKFFLKKSSDDLDNIKWQVASLCHEEEAYDE